MTETTKKIGYAVGGLIVGALLGGGLYLLGAEDEDRPPIIVRGGSIYFQSGDPGAGEEIDKLGKRWRKDKGEWQPDHRFGKKTTWFVVEIDGGEACPALSLTKEIQITYTPPVGVETQFALGMRERPHGIGGGPAPAIVTTAELDDAGNSGNNPYLRYGTDGGGSIRVQFQPKRGTPVNCDKPTRLEIRAF